MYLTVYMYNGDVFKKYFTKATQFFKNDNNITP